MIISEWTRDGGISKREGKSDVLYMFDNLKREWRCSRCRGKGVLVLYPPGIHDIDEWHMACSKCGNTTDFTHTHQIHEENYEVQKLRAQLDRGIPGQAELDDLLALVSRGGNSERDAGRSQAQEGSTKDARAEGSRLLSGTPGGGP